MTHYPSPGQFRSADAFRDHLQAVAPDLDLLAEPGGPDGPLAQPLGLHLRTGAFTLANRFAIHPMEGWDGTADGLPSEHTLRRWQRFGHSGAALIWGGEAFAVVGDARANPNQLFLNDSADTERGLRDLLAALRRGREEIGGDPDAMLVGLQLTHSGRWSRPLGEPAPRIAYHHPVLDARLGLGPEHAPVHDDALDALVDRYVAAAALAHRVGFRFVDVKACHGYLLHELLGARMREGRHGGALENRARLFRAIVAAIRDAVPGLDVAVRVSIGDVFPYQPGDGRVGTPEGWDRELPWPHQFGIDRDDPRRIDLRESFEFLALVRDLGIRLVNLTLGSPYYVPHLQRPAVYPPSDGYLPPEDPLCGVAEHLRAARACNARFEELTFVGTGYSYLQEWLPHVAAHEVGAGHVDVVGIGRMALVYPELCRDVVEGRTLDRRRICRTFSDCTTAPRNGMISGCYPLDEYYRTRPDALRVQELRRKANEP